MALTKDEMKVLLNIIGAVETGGQVYGEGDYADFTPAYANSSEEHGITIGKYQHYATEARDLLKRIKKADPELFAELDTEEIASDLIVRNWSYYKILKGSAKAKCIQRIISSDVGIRVQDEMAAEQMAQFVKEAEKLGVTDHQAQCMFANYRHQGGLGAMKRVFSKTKQPYNLDNAYNASKSDTGNQVGAYKTRQKFVYESLKKYWPTQESSNTGSISRNTKFIGEITASYLNIRVEPETTASKLKSYPVLEGGTKVDVCDEVINSEGNKWYFIKYNGKYGYASAKYIKPLK